MATVTPFFSTAETVLLVYHDDNRCKSAHQIRLADRSDGTGGMEKCQECERMTPGHWPETKEIRHSRQWRETSVRWWK